MVQNTKVPRQSQATESDDVKSAGWGQCFIQWHGPTQCNAGRVMHRIRIRQHSLHDSRKPWRIEQMFNCLSHKDPIYKSINVKLNDFQLGPGVFHCFVRTNCPSFGNLNPPSCPPKWPTRRRLRTLEEHCPWHARTLWGKGDPEQHCTTLCHAIPAIPFHHWNKPTSLSMCPIKIHQVQNLLPTYKDCNNLGCRRTDAHDTCMPGQVISLWIWKVVVILSVRRGCVFLDEPCKLR